MTTIEANDGVTGQMYSQPQTVGQMSSAPANHWHSFFGPPAGEIRTNPYDKYQYETYTLPDAYVGKNIFIRDTIEGFLDQSNNWYTTVALPVQVTDQLHVTWNEFRFDQALAAIVPEEGISRLITSSKEAREDHTIRHGLAFVLEHGFMTTDEGRRQYLLNIQQIAQSVQETNNYDVVSALLNCREYEREWEKRHSMIRTPWNELGKREVMEFAIVQKDFRGFEILHEKYKSRLNRYGVTPSMWVFPPGLALYATFSPTVADYAKETPGVELATGPEALGSFRGLNVYETREFDVRNGELPINLLQRRVQVGEHYYMRNHHSDVANYRTNTSMDIVVYNEDRDDWEKISFRDAFNHIDRFRGDFTLDTDDWGPDAPPGDLFSYKTTDYSDDNSHSWCDVFGQMDDAHLSSEALRAFCESAEAYLNRKKNKKAGEGGEGGEGGEDPAKSKASGGDGTDPEDDANGMPDNYPNVQDICKDIFGESVITGPADLSEAIYGRPRLFKKNGAAAGEDKDGGLSTEIAKFPDKTKEQLNALAVDKSPAFKAALTEYLRRNQVRKAQVDDIPKTAKFQELLAGLSATGSDVKGYQPTDRLLNRKVILSTAADLFVFLNGQWVNVGDVDYRDELLALVKPLSVVTAEGVFKSGGELGTSGGEVGIAGAFDVATIGSKRSGDSAENPSWSKKRRGVADFADSFAPVGAANKGVNSYNYPGKDKDGDMLDEGDFNTLVQGLTSNNKHIAFAAKVATLSTDVQMVIARCFYMCRVRGDVLSLWMNNNICLPFSVLIARPHMTYDMCTCIMMKGGNETGATFQGHSDFQLGDDVQSKIHYGNYTYYSKAIVTNHKNIILARNVLAKGYAGGDGCKWRHGDVGDMYAFLVPYDEHKKANPLRLFGLHPDDPERSMTGALYYARKHEKTSIPSDTKFSTLSEQEDSNDICYMGHHFWWKPHREHQEMGMGSYTGVTINTGHWGDRVYPGCGRVRAGDEVYLKEMNYGQEVF